MPEAIRSERYLENSWVLPGSEELARKVERLEGVPLEEVLGWAPGLYEEGLTLLAYLEELGEMIVLSMLARITEIEETPRRVSFRFGWRFAL